MSVRGCWGLVWVGRGDYDGVLIVSGLRSAIGGRRSELGVLKSSEQQSQQLHLKAIAIERRGGLCSTSKKLLLDRYFQTFEAMSPMRQPQLQLNWDLHSAEKPRRSTAHGKRAEYSGDDMCGHPDNIMAVLQRRSFARDTEYIHNLAYAAYILYAICFHIAELSNDYS
jgi:hypothetical protein